MSASLETLVRSRDPESSWAAAESISVELANELETWVLYELGREPLADHELVRLAPFNGFYVTSQRIRTVRNALVLAGLVEWNGGFHLTVSGRKARVWQVRS